VDAYYLDDHLSRAEGTRRFSDDGRGGEASSEGCFVVAIRRRGCGDCLFRFSDQDRPVARLMLQALNRAAAAQLERDPAA
jgi:hypothetical protein